MRDTVLSFFFFFFFFFLAHLAVRGTVGEDRDGYGFS